MHKYNHHFPDDATPQSLVEDREKMLKEHFGKVGEGVYIEPPVNIDYGCNISVGDGFYSNFKYEAPKGTSSLPTVTRAILHANPSSLTSLVILDCGMVRIGDRVMFGPFVSIFAATHETGVQSRRDGVEYAGTVVIGDDCWIGGNVTIMPGVTIGKGCTIGSGSIVTKSIPEFSVAIGNPAKVVKKVDPVPDIKSTQGEPTKSIPEP